MLCRVLSGELGGPFGDFAGLIGENLGVERDSVNISGGSVTIGSTSSAQFEAFQGPGGPVTIKGAPLAFAPEYRAGTASGRSDRFGLSFDASYGESAEFEYSSESTEHIRA